MTQYCSECGAWGQSHWPGGSRYGQHEFAIGVDLALHEDATIAMTLVKNEANDSYLPLSGSAWTVEQGADRFIEVLRSKGWRFVRD